jgi:hypothetical protein
MYAHKMIPGQQIYRELQLRERLILNLPTEDLREDTEDRERKLRGSLLCFDVAMSKEGGQTEFCFSSVALCGRRKSC